MVSNTTQQNCNLSLLKKITLDRPSPSNDIYPLSQIILDISSFMASEGEYDTIQKKMTSAITKKLNYYTRKTDIKTCIHKSNCALLLSHTLTLETHTLFYRIHATIKL